MKTFLKLGAVSLWIVSCTITSTSGQTQTDNKNEFLSYYGQFGIELPNYSEYKTDVLDVSGRRFGVTTYKWTLPAGQFSVSYAEGWDELETPEHSGAFLTAIRDLMVSLAGRESRLISERKLAFDNHAGLQLVSEVGETQTITTVFLVRKRFYILTMSLNAAQRNQAATAERTLASFRLLPRTLLNDMLARRVGTLPQEPFIERPTTDAQDENLKAKVKRVIEEHEYYDGDHLSGIRHLVSEMEFNERGYLTKSTYYFRSDDLPSVVIVYGYLNGERAARIGPKIDLLKFKYKYNGKGQLTDKRVFWSNGKEFQTKMYDPNRKRIEQYGFLNMGFNKVTYSLNKNGDPEEELGSSAMNGPITYDLGETTYKEQGRIYFDYRFTYAYEFDPQGNWMKRTSSSVEKRNGKTVATPTSITDRTIIYY